MEDGDFLRQLEWLGVTARLKRLSDELAVSIRDLYAQQRIDLEASWHAVLLYLKDRAATQVELATALRLSQPAVTKMVRRMVARGYLEVQPDWDDGRKKRIRLSRRARRRLPRFERVWAAGQTAVGELLGHDQEFLEQLGELEGRLQQRSFLERASAHLEVHNTTRVKARS